MKKNLWVLVFLFIAFLPIQRIDAIPSINIPFSNSPVIIDGSIDVSEEYGNALTFVFGTRDGDVTVYFMFDEINLYLGIDVDGDITWGEQIWIGFDLNNDGELEETNDLWILWHGDPHGDPDNTGEPWIWIWSGTDNTVTNIPDINHNFQIRTGGYQTEFSIARSFFELDSVGFHIRHSPDNNLAYIWEVPDGTEVEGQFSDHDALRYGVLSFNPDDVQSSARELQGLSDTIFPSDIKTIEYVKKIFVRNEIWDYIIYEYLEYDIFNININDGYFDTNLTHTYKVIEESGIVINGIILYYENSTVETHPFSKNQEYKDIISRRINIEDGRILYSLSDSPLIDEVVITYVDGEQGGDIILEYLRTDNYIPFAWSWFYEDVSDYDSVIDYSLDGLIYSCYEITYSEGDVYDIEYVMVDVGVYVYGKEVVILDIEGSYGKISRIYELNKIVYWNNVEYKEILFQKETPTLSFSIQKNKINKGGSQIILGTINPVPEDNITIILTSPVTFSNSDMKRKLMIITTADQNGDFNINLNKINDVGTWYVQVIYEGNLYMHEIKSSNLSFQVETPGIGRALAAYLVGGLLVVLIVGRGVVSIRRRRREGKARAVAEQRERILGLVVGSGDVLVLGDVARGLDVSEVEVRGVIEWAVVSGVLAGQFSNDGRTFITDEVFRRIVKDKLGITNTEKYRIVNSHKSKVKRKQAGENIIEPFIKEDGKSLRTKNWTTYSPNTRKVGMKVLEAGTAVGLGVAAKRAGSHSILVDGLVEVKIIPYNISGVEWILVGISSQIEATILDELPFGNAGISSGKKFRFIKFKPENWLKVEETVVSIFSSIRDVRG